MNRLEQLSQIIETIYSKELHLPDTTTSHQKCHLLVLLGIGKR